MYAIGASSDNPASESQRIKIPCASSSFLSSVPRMVCLALVRDNLRPAPWHDELTQYLTESINRAITALPRLRGGQEFTEPVDSEEALGEWDTE